MLKKQKNKTKNTFKKETEINATIKRQLKNTTKKYNKKRRGNKKEWVKGEEEPTEKIFVQCFCLNHLKGIKKVRSVKNSKFSFGSDLLIFLIFSAVADMNWYN